MKRIFTLLICVFIVSQVLGQWSAGGLAGVNTTKQTGRWYEDSQSEHQCICGPILGAWAAYQFCDRFSLAANLMYLKLGMKYVETYEGEGSYTFSEKERLNSMQLNILATVLVATWFLNYYAIVGPYFTQKFGGRIIIEDSYSTTKYKAVWGEEPSRGDDLDKIYIDPDRYRRIDMGVYLGAALGKDLGPGELRFVFMGGIGLLDHNKFESKDAKQNAKDNGYKPFRTLNAAFMLSYVVPIGNQ
jgi:hypothetical protein